MKRLVIIVLSVLAVCQVQAEDRRLWYDKGASHWLEALPIGNSALGAMVYGGADTEQIQLNEETFWSGSPTTTTALRRRHIFRKFAN